MNPNDLKFYDLDTPDAPVAFSVSGPGKACFALALSFDLRLIYADEPAASWERLVNAGELFQLPKLDHESPEPKAVSKVWATNPRGFACFMKGHAP